MDTPKKGAAKMQSYNVNENGTTWIVQGVRFDDYDGIDLASAKVIEYGSYADRDRAMEKAARLASGADDYDGCCDNQSYSAAYFYRCKELHVGLSEEGVE